MPSVFQLSGDLEARTTAFQKSLQDADTRLKATDANLNKVIASSNRLGDTSATVARRYEKLSEGIALQNTRLKDAANSVLSGDITWKKYLSTISSVETQTRSLNSRIADAKARVQELNETNLTHFQQQIAGAVDKSHSLINLNAARPLQGLGPVLQGLGARQFGLDETILNILIVAAREAGILKVAQEGTAAATTAAAVAETRFTAAAQSAAIAQGTLAAESEVTAAAMTEAAGATTIFGVGLAAAGAVLAAGVVSILAAKKASEDYLASAQERLKTEEAITAEWNKQSQLISSLKPQLDAATKQRAFDRFANSDDIAGLEIGLAARQRERDEITTAISNERAYRNAVLSEHPEIGAKFGQQYLAEAATQQQKDRLKELNEQIPTLYAKIDELHQASVKGIEDFVKGGQQRQLEAVKNQAKEVDDARKSQLQSLQASLKSETSILASNYKVQEAQLSAHLALQQAGELSSAKAVTALKNQQLRDEINVDTKYYNALIANSKDAGEAEKFRLEGQASVTQKLNQIRENEIRLQTTLIEKTREAGRAFRDTFAGLSDNPFVKIFTDAEKAMDAAKAKFADFPALFNQIASAINNKAFGDTIAQRFSNNIASFNLRDQAQQFRRGSLDTPQVAGLKNALNNPNLTDFDRQGLQQQLQFAENFDLQNRLQGQLNSFNAFGNVNVNDSRPNGLAAQNLFLAATQHERDRKIIDLTNGIDPSRLTFDQNQLAADARIREADFQDKKEEEARKNIKDNTTAVRELTAAVKSGSIVRIVNQAKDKAKVEIKPSAADSADYYSKN